MFQDPLALNQHHENILTMIDESDLEGTLVLEKLAEIGRVEDFFDAVDADDFLRAAALMRRARVDVETISAVLKKMGSADLDL